MHAYAQHRARNPCLETAVDRRHEDDERFAVVVQVQDHLSHDLQDGERQRFVSGLEELFPDRLDV
ncbi:MAG: hypothetical protein EOQ63_24430 [Mesorhizobium sp.]|uniref:hypothetical protein n=1 Tax=Mesorhizobium sp. TaxID=1871066 RepID=UPI000FE7103F|nr:hypothetical protein [Mesorhizobium sp.]RWG44084.1 MAG: hypothetical protein EOQ63_24430 [Mesorhizobium sp.]